MTVWMLLTCFDEATSHIKKTNLWLPTCRCVLVCAHRLKVDDAHVLYYLGV